MTFEQLRGTIQAHDVRLESCDRDGQEFCDCLERAIDQLEATVAAKPFNPDWSLLEATQESLREQTAALKAAQESEQRFREQVAAALRELRARIATESVDLTPENAAGYSRDIADAENATVELALRHVDTTIAALGLASTCAATPEEREQQQMEVRKQWILAGGDLPAMRADASLFVDTMPLTKFELEEQ